MAVPYIFSPLPNGSTIPLSHLDADFAYLDNLVEGLDIRLPVYVLTNIAALRLLAVTPSYNVLLNGYYTNGDGGGGYFYPAYGALPGHYVDNGGTIIVPTGGDGSSAWLRSVSGPINVKWFGAKGDASVEDSASIQAALNSGYGHIYIPSGLYLVHNLTIPANVTVSGDGMDESTLLGSQSCDHVLYASGGNVVSSLKINCNNLASKGIAIAGDFCDFYDNQVQYGSYGFYNINKDVHNFVGNRTNNNTYGIYSADRFITCVIDRHWSGNETYAVYLTYSAQQPQFVTISNCSFESNVNGVYVKKDIYWFIIENTSFDSISGYAIQLDTPAPGAGSSIYIKNNYISAETSAVNIAAGYQGVVISQNQIANSSGGLVGFAGTASVHSSDVVIADNNFGQCGQQSIYIDSVQNCTIEGNVFSYTFGAPYNATYDIVTLKTYSGMDTIGPIYSIRNKFVKSTPYNPVGLYILSYLNLGWVTKADGVVGIGNTLSYTTVTHGLNGTPTKILLTPQANIGNVWASNITSTTFNINCSIASTGTSYVTWTAQSD